MLLLEALNIYRKSLDQVVSITKKTQLSPAVSVSILTQTPLGFRHWTKLRGCGWPISTGDRGTAVVRRMPVTSTYVLYMLCNYTM